MAENDYFNDYFGDYFADGAFPPFGDSGTEPAERIQLELEPRQRSFEIVPRTTDFELTEQ